MTFSRPTVFSRAPEALCFSLGAIVIISSLGYAVWVQSRGLIEWGDVLPLWAMFSIGTVPIIAVGGFCRWHRCRKQAALREYERILALGHQN
jgi:hypothetical protein